MFHSGQNPPARESPFTIHSFMPSRGSAFTIALCPLCQRTPGQAYLTLAFRLQPWAFPQPSHSLTDFAPVTFLRNDKRRLSFLRNAKCKWQPPILLFLL